MKKQPAERLNQADLKSNQIAGQSVSAFFGDWLRQPLALAYILAVGLGLTLDVTGALHVYGLDALAGQKLSYAGALLLAGFALIGLRLATSPSPFAARDDIVATFVSLPIRRLLIGLLLAAWLATARNWFVFLLPHTDSIAWLIVVGGGLALLLALVYPPPPGWILLGAVVFGSLVRAGSFAGFPIEPARGDMLPLVQGALGNLLSGHSPYTIYAMPWELPLTYLPVAWLAYLPPFAVGLDIRLTNLVAELAIGALLYGLAVAQRRAADPSLKWSAALAFVWSYETALLLWAWVFLLPTSVNWSLTTTAPVQWLFIAATLVLFLRGRRRLTALALGLCAAATPLAAIIGLFVGLHWLRTAGWRRALALSGGALLVATLISAPFFIWAPGPFVLGAWRWFNDNDMYPRLRWEMDNIWAFMIGFSGVFWRHDLVGLLKPLQAILLLGLGGVFWLYRCAAWRAAPIIVAAYLLFTMFNPVLWPYLYNPALIAALITATMLAQGW